MMKPSFEVRKIHTLDLNFLGMQRVNAAYLIPHQHGAVLIECGPGSTIPTLRDGLNTIGFSISDISDVLLTHIHLDHAGASGWLANQGVRIHVHPLGAPHLRNPQKLLDSARRIYGDEMERLWGDFLPVPPDKLVLHQDQEIIELEGLVIRALDTPGHANHHFVYIYEGICFSGDIGGVRMTGNKYLRLPMPPPEFHLESWRHSLQILSVQELNSIVPTHFGFHSDPDWHLATLKTSLDEVEAWMQATMPKGLPIEEINTEFIKWERQHSLRNGIDPEVLDLYETANPSWMSTLGIQRYWRKYRQGK
jgi:glyoxylase-like metal-dependent hydrolase (beta-lactamase superfamily II)